MKSHQLLFRSPVRFAQGWEDYNVIQKGLEEIENKTIIGILASGDNILNLLCLKPKKIFAFDISDPEIYEMNLKITAIKFLTYEDFIKLLGYDGVKRERLQIFNLISNKLDEATYKFWNSNLDMITKGLSFSGWWEKYVSNWRYILKLFLGKDFDRYISSECRSERKEIFEKRINRPILKYLSKLFVGKIATNFIFKKNFLKNKIFEPARYDRFWKQARHFLVNIPCKNNPYHYWIFTDEMPDNREYWQPYLREQNFQVLKKYIDNVEIINNDILNGLNNFENNSIDCFYLSDIFDWGKTEYMQKTLLEVVRTGKNESKIVIFVLNHDKTIPKKLKKNIICDKKMTAELTKIERVGLYLKVYRFILNK